MSLVKLIPLLLLATPVQAELYLEVDTQAQTLSVYDDDVLLETIVASTGREGKDTPLGEFTVLQKRIKHRSTIYGSSMPYMQRLTWDGIAIHAGNVSSPFASHGCIRVSEADAERLFSLTRNGTRVYVR